MFATTAPPSGIRAGHTIVEVMASSWDEAGYRPPRNWRVTCSCDWGVRNLRTQTDAFDAWQEHRDQAGGVR